MLARFMHRLSERCRQSRTPLLLRSSVLVSLTLAGCGGASVNEGEGSQPVVRDSAGIRIVENVLPAAPPVWARLSDQPTVSIPPGEGEDALLRVVGAEEMPDGTILVGTLRGTPVMRFGADGRYLGALARRGRGPGELQSIDGFFLRGSDTLVVWDPLTALLSTFLTSGPVTSQSLAGKVQVTLSGVVGEFLPGELLLRERGPPVPLMQQGKGLARDTTVLLLLRTGREERAEPLLKLPGLKVILMSQEVNGQRMPGMAISLDYHDAWAVAGGTRGFVINADAVDIRVIDSTGLRERWTLSVPPVPVGEAEVSALKSTTAEEFGETVLRAWEPLWASVPPPTTRPAVAGLLRSRDGTLWVERYSLVTDSVRRYHVFGPEGVYVGDVTTPRPFRILSAARDHVLGVVRDEDGLESVVRYALVSPPGTHP